MPQKNFPQKSPQNPQKNSKNFSQKIPEQNSAKKIKILSRGRLSPEKWIPQLLAAREIFQHDPARSQTEFHIFGDGPLLPAVQQRSTKFPTQIFTHGRASHATIRAAAQDAHAAILPSRFLETFGLTALEALARGLPVRAEIKGGLRDFLPAQRDLAQFDGNFPQQLAASFSQISRLPPAQLATQKSEAHQIARHFSHDTRTQNLENFWRKKFEKILLVTDFWRPRGGIESHVSEIPQNKEKSTEKISEKNPKKISEKNFTTATRSPPKFLPKKIAVLAGLLLSTRNPLGAHILKKSLKNFHKKSAPDLIRAHSILRFFSTANLKLFKKIDAPRWFTLHDLGYFCLRPSSITSESQIPATRSRPEFRATAPRKNFLTRLAARRKFRKLSQLRRELRDRDRIFVPANFLKPHLARLREIPPEKITVLPHFLPDDKF